jgi:hypothetical protein
MKAAVFHKPGDIRYDTMPFPRIYLLEAKTKIPSDLLRLNLPLSIPIMKTLSKW